MLTGHKAYLGSLILEHTYNNAVVQTFVRLMVDGLKERERHESAVLFGGIPSDQHSMDEAAGELSGEASSSSLGSVCRGGDGHGTEVVCLYGIMNEG